MKGNIYTDDIGGKIYDSKLLARLVRYLKPYTGHVVVSMVFLLLLTAIQLYMPILTMIAIDRYIVSDLNLVSFDDKNEFDGFVEKYDKLKLNTFEHDGNGFVLLPVKKLNRIFKEDISKLEEDGSYLPGQYVLCDVNDKTTEILSGLDDPTLYRQISDSRYAVQQKVFALVGEEKFLSRSEIVTMRADSLHSLLIIGAVYLVLVILRFVFQYCQVYFINYAAQYAMLDLRKEAFGYLQKLPLSFFDRNPVGRLVTRVTNDIRALDEMLSAGLIDLLQNILMLIGIIVAMLILDLRFALVTLTILPFVVLHLKLFKDKIRVAFRDVRKKLAALNATLSEDISGFRIIQLFNQYARKVRYFGSINHEYLDAGFKQMRIFAIFRPLIFTMRNVVVALLLWYGGGLILKHAITVGLLIAFLQYMERFFDPIHHISEKFNVLQAAMSGAERVFHLMSEPVKDYRDEQNEKVLVSGEIEFRNVWLSYLNNDEYALKDISFKVAPGESIALVGHTGSGKTSIVNLLTDMYEFQKGDILLDGTNLRNYRLEDIRKNIGIVQQDVFLFSGNIRENIVLNDATIDDDTMQKVARYVNVDAFIESLPMKYEEEVTERGSTFSVGQRQLIAFARVLAYDPAIFILDEATSNIDTETEIMIQEAIKVVMKGRTSIIIAHRLSTIKHVDRIIVMHKGRIVEQGTHNQLIASRGVYYDLYRLQFE